MEGGGDFEADARNLAGIKGEQKYEQGRSKGVATGVRAAKSSEFRGE